MKGAVLYSTSEQNLVLNIKFPFLEQFKLTIFIEEIGQESSSAHFVRDVINIIIIFLELFIVICVLRRVQISLN